MSIVVTKRKNLSNIARESQRCGVSFADTATICNALLNDLGLGTADNMLDKSQIYRNVKTYNRNAVDEQLLNIHKSISELECCGLYFDGKKDKTKTIEINSDTSKQHQRIHLEEHYALLFQPNNQYYTHISPDGSKAEHIADSIMKKLREDKIDLKKIKFLGCDGTNLNTGVNGGMFCLSHFTSKYRYI